MTGGTVAAAYTVIPQLALGTKRELAGDAGCGGAPGRWFRRREGRGAAV